MKILNKVPRCNGLLLIASITAISVGTIFPFNFQIPAEFSEHPIWSKFEFTSSVKDYWQNILLFIPLGISLAAFFTKSEEAPSSYGGVSLTGKKLSISVTLVVVCLFSVLTSSVVEIIQLFLPSRVSNVTDIICNGLGGTFGTILYFGRKQIGRFLIGIIQGDADRLSLKSLLIAIASYCSLIMVMIGVLLINTNLSNWDENYYFTIGNEVSEDRPWNGKIRELQISDRRFNPSEVQRVFAVTETFFAQSSDLVTSFKFSEGEKYYPDRRRNLPKLLWQGLPENKQQLSEQEILVNSQHWLKTAQPAIALIRQLKHTGQFSLYLAVSSNNPQQFGPARIISLSQGTTYHNLLLGQEGTDLHLRLRTPITGNSASQPRFKIPKIFENNDLNRILVIFAQKKLDIYINSPENHYSFKFTPANSFFSYLPWTRIGWIVNLEEFNPLQYQLLFYTIIFTPLAILISYFFFSSVRQHN